MAELFHALGATVTLVEALPSILPVLDGDISKEAARLLNRRKITAHTGTTAAKFEIEKNVVHVGLANGKTVEAEKVLVVIGRRPCTSDIKIVIPNFYLESGCVAVDETGRTGAEKLFAIGDVTGRMMLAHFASAQCAAAVREALGEEPEFNADAVPAVVDTRPEIASVGMTEAQARETGRPIKTARFDVRALGRAQAEDEIIGFVKIIGDEGSGRVLGMHIMAHGAGEIIHEGALAIRKRMSVKDLAETVHAHPSFSEAIEEAAHLWLGRPRHA
jgi:dihydrolipoamide dehydrogenase